MLLLPVIIVILITTLVDSCSISCGYEGAELCVDKVWYGPLGASCGGFLGCFFRNETCNGECASENPVISLDGKNCAPCDYTNETLQSTCSGCKTGTYGPEFWCTDEGLCKSKNSTCNGKCPLPSFPVQDGDECKDCLGGNIWCTEESKCYDPYIEPCNNKCHEDGWKIYCAESNTCVDRYHRDDFEERCGNSTIAV